mgnify:FL=1
MKKISVNKNDAGNRLDKFINKCFPNIPYSLLYKYIRKKRIKVNGKKEEISYRLKENDILELYINDELLEKSNKSSDFKAASEDIEILYEDDNIMIINKKAGLIVHPDDDIKVDCLVNRIKNYLFKKGEFNPENENSFAPALVNRIDRNTSGIVIAAKNAESLRILNLKMKERELHKKYICILCGTLKKDSEILKAFLDKNSSENKVYISNKMKNKNYKTILTKYSVIDKSKKFTLAEIELLTGRTHQIRAHMAYLGYPLLGDGKYGVNKINREMGYKYQALCAYKLKFDFKDKDNILGYLDGKEFGVNMDKIWFVNDFYKRLVNIF